MIIDRPARFTGSEEEREVNRETHQFVTYRFGEDDFESECVNCLCHPWSDIADWPCGQEQREILVVDYPDYNDAEREDH